jgi:hypothetical protein
MIPWKWLSWTVVPQFNAPHYSNLSLPESGHLQYVSYSVSHVFYREAPDLAAGVLILRDWQEYPWRQNATGSEFSPSDLWINAASDLDVRQRGNLIELDRQLHLRWGLGRNFVLACSPYEQGALLLVVPHYAIAEYALGGAVDAAPESGSVQAQEFIMQLLAGSRHFSLRQLQNAARLLQVEPTYVKLRQPLRADMAEIRVIERLIRRYGISYVPSRAVAMFDIVGFSLLNPFEQMTQLNSLSHSLNSAHSKMLSSRLGVDFARSSTGDGFYIWNRFLGPEGNRHLYQLMQLVLADNAIAQRKARGKTVPLLRACFHVGGCYEFHHAEGLNPTLHSEIVGDVTIELARMIERTLPGQILVGDFHAAGALSADSSADGIDIDAIQFMELAQDQLASLNGLELSGDAIESIKCYLTGRARADGTFSIRKLSIADKHGLTHSVFNAKVNIYRRTGEPILLGIEDRHLGSDDLSLSATRDIGRPQPN